MSQMRFGSLANANSIWKQIRRRTSVVEIDIMDESLHKFPLYAALSLPEIWRYDSKKVQFYQLAGETYYEVSESRFLPGLIPTMLASALKHSKKDGQDAALDSFRQQIYIR